MMELERGTSAELFFECAIWPIDTLHIHAFQNGGTGQIDITITEFGSNDTIKTSCTINDNEPMKRIMLDWSVRERPNWNAPVIITRSPNDTFTGRVFIENEFVCCGVCK